jgi:hypothetical protein
MNTANSLASQAIMESIDHAELISDLTLDELRDLPVGTQMGLDLTACEDCD